MPRKMFRQFHAWHGPLVFLGDTDDLDLLRLREKRKRISYRASRAGAAVPRDGDMF